MKKSERGQVLVLIILTIVVLFGFAALAVDGGRIYAERRRAQNAADAAAYAAAFADLEKQTAAQQLTAAMALAAENGFVPTPGRVEVEYHHPPISGRYQGNSQYHQVVIRSAVDKIFAQFVFTGDMAVTVEAVARARPTLGIFPGKALVSTNESACEAMWFSGAGTTTINGGSVYSSSDGTGKTGNCYSGTQNGSGGITVNGGNIFTVGGWNTASGAGTVKPTPKEYIDREEFPDVPTPDCSHLTSRGSFSQSGSNASNTIKSGRYNGIRVNGGKLYLDPGMYCLSDDFVVGGGAELEGRGVMIVMLKGSVSFQGGGAVVLTHSQDLVDGAGNQWGGMLIYMPEDNHGGVDIGGGAGSVYTGTIFAPGPRAENKAKCDIYGSSGTIGLSSNVICDTVHIHGTANFVVNFKEEKNFRMPPMIDLTE